jgi:hypothetical protein
VLNGPRLSGPAKPCLDFIDDQQGPCLRACFSDDGIEFFGRIDIAPFSLDRLNNDAGGFRDSGIGGVEDVVNVFRAGTATIGIFQVHKATVTISVRKMVNLRDEGFVPHPVVVGGRKGQ